MAKLSNSTESNSESDYGNQPIVNERTLEAENRVITSVSQAIQLMENDIEDARILVENAALITEKKNGGPPFDSNALEDQGKSWKRNISTRFFQKNLARVAPRLYMPILTASTMTAAALPAGWPDGLRKSEFFRSTATKFIRSWKKNDWFWRGLKTEVADYGYAFAVFLDPYEWRPSLVRMDRGFVPRGTEIMDENIARFTLKYEYKPDELLRAARKAIDSGSEMWNKESVAAAVQGAEIPSIPSDDSQLRTYEDLIREGSVDMNSTKSNRVIKTQHLWILEYSGKVSHYIFWPDGPSEFQLLFEHLDAYDSMFDVVIPEVFSYGNGTIDGSWGAGQLLYDLAGQVEIIRNDGMDNLINSNKVRLQVPNAKDAAAAQLVVNDTMIIATGATFAQNIGGISGNPEGYLVLDDRMTRWAEEIVGSYLPPIPTQSSDIKAAQINAALMAEQEVQRDVLEASLKQDAHIIAAMLRRALNKDTNDKEAIAFRNTLLGKEDEEEMTTLEKAISKVVSFGKKIFGSSSNQAVVLTEEEIDILVNQPVIQTVTEFTPFAKQQKAAFAQAVQGNPLYNQVELARIMADAAGGQEFADAVVIAENDTTMQTAQLSKQMMENSAMLVTGQPMPVLVTDNHKIHLDAMADGMNQVIMSGNLVAARAGLQHYAAHFEAGSANKSLGDEVNNYKSLLASFQKAIEVREQELQIQQMQQQIAQGQVPQAQVPQAPQQIV